MIEGVRRAVRQSLWEKVPRDHRESERNLRRRQWVTAGFVVAGAVLLALSLRIKPGNALFYPATLGLAAVWTVGAFTSGPLHLGRTLRGDEAGPRPVAMPVAYGALLAALFVVGGLVVCQVPWLDSQVRHVLDHANSGSTALLVLITALNGVAEELFFRGALYAATPRHPVIVTAVAYTAAEAVEAHKVLGASPAVGCKRRILTYSPPVPTRLSRLSRANVRRAVGGSTRFYNRQHTYYCVIDLHVKTMLRLYPCGSSSRTSRAS